MPDTFTRKQTLTTGERYITPELKELENKILGANERLLVLEHQLFADLLSSISAEVVRIQRTASAVAQLDVLAGFAEAALQNNYVMPNVDESGVMEIKEGRHPVIEQMLKGSLFVPNDTMLDEDENRMLLITGPNMAGKSTYMRQNALIALMAQIGSFVPAAAAHIGVVDAIFTRVGASDDLAAGQSTFMVEMTEVAEILKNATKDSLVILDEIGRGTSTFDGMSIARSVVEFICENDRLQDAVRHALPRADGAWSRIFTASKTIISPSKSAARISRFCAALWQAPPTTATASRSRSSRVCPAA